MNKISILVIGLVLCCNFLFPFGKSEVAEEKAEQIYLFINSFHETILKEEDPAIESFFLNSNVNFYIQNNDLSGRNIMRDSEVDHVFSESDFNFLYAEFSKIVGPMKKRVVNRIEYSDDVYDSSQSRLYIVIYEVEYLNKKIREVFFVKDLDTNYKIFKYQIFYRSDSYLY